MIVSVIILVIAFGDSFCVIILIFTMVISLIITCDEYFGDGYENSFGDYFRDCFADYIDNYFVNCFGVYLGDFLDNVS